MLSFGLLTTATALDSEETTDVEVTVDEVAQVDVRPSNLDYTDTALETGELREESDEGFEHVEIENIGTVDIEEVTAESTVPSEQPFGGTSAEHNTGNFVTMSVETAEAGDNGDYDVTMADGSTSETPHFLNRVEFAEDNEPQYISVETEEEVPGAADETTFDPSDVEVGRIRVGDVEYFFVAYYSGSAGATDDEFNLRIGRAPHTSTQLGTVDFTNSNEDGYVEYLGGEDVTEASGELAGKYGRVDGQEFLGWDTDAVSDSDYEGEDILDGDGNVIDSGEEHNLFSATDPYEREYNLYAAFDEGAYQSHIVRTRFNAQVFDVDNPDDKGTVTSTSAQTPLITGGSDDLNPGQNVPINFGVEIPLGVESDAGINTGTVTFVVTQDAE